MSARMIAINVLNLLEDKEVVHDVQIMQVTPDRAEDLCSWAEANGLGVTRREHAAREGISAFTTYSFGPITLFVYRQ